ncbi:MAG: type VI secretion system-associated protein TagF [Burkholderiaceae bacterium]
MNALVPGWFGKLPALGDYASRRLPPVFVDGWDAWLQRELARSRAALGERWLDAFLVAPVRRYWLAPGLLGPRAWAGVWMPSVDAVGRHYPLTIAAPCRCADAWLLARDAAAWFDALDAAARQALDPACNIDAFERVLAGVPAMPALPADASARAAGRGSRWWCAGVAQASALMPAVSLPAGGVFDALLQPCP